MNCKQGDLAIVVCSPNGLNAGKIVRCVRFIGVCRTNPLTGLVWFRGDIPDAWEIEPPLDSHHMIRGQIVGNLPISAYPDSYLRPLRGDLLDEETKEPVMVES